MRVAKKPIRLCRSRPKRSFIFPSPLPKHRLSLGSRCGRLSHFAYANPRFDYVSQMAGLDFHIPVNSKHEKHGSTRTGVRRQRWHKSGSASIMATANPMSMAASSILTPSCLPPRPMRDGDNKEDMPGANITLQRRGYIAKKRNPFLQKFHSSGAGKATTFEPFLRGCSRTCGLSM